MDPIALAAVARRLERAVIALALAALAYRALVQPRIPPPPGAAWGSGEVVDFALGLGVFLLGGTCAVCGVALFARADAPAARAAAYRPVVVGMTTFVVYYLLHPYVPALA